MGFDLRLNQLLNFTLLIYKQTLEVMPTQTAKIQYVKSVLFFVMRQLAFTQSDQDLLVHLHLNLGYFMH